MKININELKAKNQKHFTMDAIIEDIEDIDFKILKPIKVNFSIDFLAEEIYISGSFETRIETTCVRCLGIYEKDLSGEIEGRFLDASSFSEYMKTQDEEIESDMTAYEVIEGDQIDLKELVREHVILELDPFGVCSEECVGLEEAENYADDGIDSRWLDLLEMSKKINK